MLNITPHSIYLWLLMGGVFLAVSVLYFWEDRSIRARFPSNSNNRFLVDIRQSLRLRNFLSLAVMGVCFVSVAVYDSQNQLLKEKLEEAHRSTATAREPTTTGAPLPTSELPAIAIAANAPATNTQTVDTSATSNTTPESAPSTPQLTPSQTTTEQQDYYPPIVSQDELALNAALHNTAQNTASQNLTPAAPTAKSNIQDVFNSAPTNADSAIDSLKTRYEEILVTHLFMKKCGKAQAEDYPLIMSALQKDINRSKAPIRLQYDIVNAAKGSYEELYSKHNCNQPDVEISARQYSAYIRGLSAPARRY